MNKYYPEESVVFAESIDNLRGSKVAVVGHFRPDGDCIGSMVALTRLLNTMGIEAVAVNRDPVPENLKAFVGDTPLLLAEDFEAAGYVAVTVDCADRKRIGDRLQECFPEIELNIDHHISNREYARRNLIIGTACATAEVLAGFCFDNGYEVDALTAQNLYVGIATDTGQFRFPSTTSDTFEIARRLCELGANPAAAAFELYENESFGKFKLLQHFLASLKLELNGRVCVGMIEEGVYADCGACVDDSEGLVDYARSIRDVDVGVFLEVRDGAIKGSLRSKDPFYRVDQVAQQFHGGGHACAAGLNVQGCSLNDFRATLIEAIDQHLKALGEAPASGKK